MTSSMSSSNYGKSSDCPRAKKLDEIISSEQKCPCAPKIKEGRHGKKNRTNYFGADFGKKTDRKIVPTFGCDVFGLPQLDGVRSERRKYPELHLRSSIVFSSPRPAGRVYTIDSSYRNQKRHYCQHNASSHLDDYY